jgi:general secretion pathway protein L
MAALGRSLGLDLGSHSIKVVELRQTLRGVELVRLHALAVDGRRAAEASPEAPRAEGSDTAGIEALREWVQAQGLAGERIVCAIPGDRVARRQMRLPFRDRRRIDQAVPFEVESETPFALEDVFVDWEQVGGGAGGADVVATVVPRRDVARQLEDLRSAGVVPRVLEVEGLVLGNLSELVELPGTRLLVDLGHRKTTLCLLVDGAPRAARTLPIGGRHLTEAIARERGIDLAEAERIKCRDGVLPAGAGGSGSPGALRVLDRLARDLNRTLGGLESALGGPAEKAIGEITLLGGGARLAGVDQLLAERTGIETARLQIAPTGPASVLIAGGDPLRFAPALALALRGTLRARTRMNFLQAEYAPRIDLRKVGQRLRGTALLAALALLLAVGAGVSRIALESRRADALERQLGQLWSEAVPGKPRPEDVPRALQQALRDAQQRADFLGIYGGNLSALDLLTEISKLVPADLQVIFEELSIDGQVVRIRGHTPSFAAVDQLKSALARFPSFSDIRVSEIQADSARGGNNFSVTISLVKSEPTP